MILYVPTVYTQLLNVPIGHETYPSFVDLRGRVRIVKYTVKVSSMLNRYFFFHMCTL